MCGRAASSWQRTWVRDGRDRLVVHPLAVGADLRAVLSEEFFQPLWVAFNDPSGAAWFATHKGTFVVTLITIAIAGLLVSLGMSGYAKVQKWCFYGGLLGFAIIVIIMLCQQPGGLRLGVQQRDRQAVRDEERRTRRPPPRRPRQMGIPRRRSGSPADLGQSMLLVPMLMFYLLWPNWGTTLYGEIRGATDFKRVFSGHVLRPVDHGAAVGRLPRAVRQDLRLQLLPGRQRELGRPRSPPRTPCRSSLTRRCWPAGW